MNKNEKTNLSARLFMLGLGIIAYTLSVAAPVPGSSFDKSSLPASTEPGVISNTLSNTQQQPTAKVAAPLKAPQEQQSTLGPQAAQIKFKLVQIILEDNHVYSNAQLEALYKDKIGKQISVEELQGIVQSITNYYRNNGYILSRAILPPQHVKDGVVHVRIIEGYIDTVHVIGKPRGAAKILKAYGDRIIQSRPLQISVMEHYLRLANEIPGMEVRAVLEPSETNVGASTLDLSAKEQTINASLSYDNYGTLYIGPQETTGNIAANSIFLAGDQTHFTYSTTMRPEELKYYDIGYQAPLTSKGLTGGFGRNISKTRPGFVLAPIDIQGDATTYYGTLTYPLLRTRDKSLTLDGGFNYIDSQVTSFTAALYTDHIRSLKFGGNYDFSDRFSGSNLVGVHAEQGFGVLGATTCTDCVTTSRFGGRGKFTKFNVTAIHLQPIFGRFSTLLQMSGQWSLNPLLSSEQFGFGGSQLGRGYDSAEIIGDRGLAGSAELRLDYAPDWRFLKTLEPYVFYDAGVIYNAKNVVDVKNKQSATSVGIGARFGFNQYFSGNLMIAQPLTKTVAAEELIDRGRNPRGFFSIVASI